MDLDEDPKVELENTTEYSSLSTISQWVREATNNLDETDCTWPVSNLQRADETIY